MKSEPSFLEYEKMVLRYTEIIKELQYDIQRVQCVCVCMCVCICVSMCVCACVRV